MPIVTKPNTFVANQIIDANQMNQNFDSIYGLVNGSLDAANLAANAINDSTKLANEVIIPSKSKGLIYATDLFGQNWVVAGGLATFSGSPVNQIQVNTVSANILQVDSTYRHVSVAGTSYTTSALNSTYYLDLQPDGTTSWGTTHSAQAGYLPLATVTTNGSGNVLAITDVRVLSAGIAWINLSKVSSSLADLAVRSATDLNSGTLNVARLPTAIPATSIGNGDVTNAILSFLNSLSSNAQTQLDAKIPLTQKGVANGVASLDSGAKVPVAQLPDAVLGALEYQGTWNATTNTPTLPSASASKGFYYVVSTAGTYNSIAFRVGDWVLSEGNNWDRVANSDTVTTVFGRLGNVIANANDYSWAQIDKTTSSLADLTTRSASDLNSGTLPVGRIPTGIPATSIGTGTVDNTKLGYLSTVTSDVQTQLNSKGTVSNGTGSPVGVVTPTIVGQLYTDTNTGLIYTATALTSASWIIQIPYSSMTQQAIINAAMEIWQQGTSFTNPADNTYTADMWMLGITNSGTLPTTIIHSQSTLTPGELFNSKYAYNINVDGAGSGFGINNFYLVKQKIEFGTSKLCGNGKKVTVSFYAKSNISGKRIAVSVAQYYGTGGSPSAATGCTPTALSIRTLTSSMALYTFTFTTNTLTGKTFGTNNDDYLSVSINLMWGTVTATNGFGGGSAETFVGSGDVSFTEVVVNAGDVALPYQPKSFSDELIACQRYYESSFMYGDAPANNIGYSGFQSAVSNGGLTNSYAGTIYYKVRKRTIPTLTFYNGGSTTAGTWQWWSTGGAGTATSPSINYNKDIGFVSYSTITSAYTLVQGNWAADARL